MLDVGCSQIYNMSIANNWRQKYNVLVGDGQDVQGDYSDLLSRSLFCLVATGRWAGGWATGGMELMLPGCNRALVRTHAAASTLAAGTPLRAQPSFLRTPF